MIVENQPYIEPLLRSGHDYRLVNDVSYRWDNKRLVILKGYIFDGASTPRILTFFIAPADPRVLSAALVHDYLYDHPALGNGAVYYVDGVQSSHVFTKKEADDLFREANKANNMDSFRTTLAYWAVRIFGRGSFVK